MSQQVAVIEKETNDLSALCRSLNIENNDDEALAVSYLQMIKNGQKAIGAEFDEGVDKSYKLYKLIYDQRKKYLDLLEVLDKNLRQKVKDYRLKLERERKAKEDEEKRIADQRVKEEQDRLIKAAEEKEKSGDIVEANKLATQSALIETGGVHVESKAVKQEGMSSKLIWKGRVSDVSKLPKEYQIITADQKKIDAYIKVNENRQPIQGVEYYQDVDMKVRA